MPGIPCMLLAGAGAGAALHEGAADAEQQDGAEVAQHDDADEEQHPQACAGVAAKAPTEVVANTIESNLNMQISLKQKLEGSHTESMSRSGTMPDRDITNNSFQRYHPPPTLRGSDLGSAYKGVELDRLRIVPLDAVPGS
jgi:hypothetical protein